MAACLLTVAAPAVAASPPVSNPRIIAHLDLSRGQTPENLALEPGGSADVTFAEAAQVARVSLDGQVRVLAQLPKPAGGAACPILGPLLGAPALTVGIVRDHAGTLYVALCTGSLDLQGIWRVSPNGSASRIAALPPGGIPNGMALDDRHGLLYVADSLLSVVWRVSIADGNVMAWAAGSQLAPNGGLGANGLKLHDGAVWVSNTQLGTLLRIPIRPDGSAGPIQTIARSLPGIDDFAFTGPGNSAPVLAAINRYSTVALIRPDGGQQTVLTAADGLSNPSAVAVRGSTVYVLSAAYLTHTDPNIMMANLDHQALSAPNRRSGQPAPRARAAAAAGDVVLSGVSCAGAARCVAVGQETTTSNLGLDFAQAWDGRRWRVLAPPSPGSPAGLSGVACTGPAACVAVGSYPGPAGPGHTLAIAWNGRQWRVLTTPSTGNSELTAIACPRPDRCVAVGDRFTSGGRRTLAEAWNGTSWRVLPAADTHSADAKLESISCAGPERCMATGISFNPATGATITLAESWDGARWQLLRTPSPGTRLSDLASVSCAGPARCIAVGSYLNSGQPVAQALAETWNGIRWRILPPLPTGRGASLAAISCTGRAQCIVIGAHVTAGNAGPLAESWNGTRWHVLPTASLGTGHGNLLALSCPRPDRCAAAGNYISAAGASRPLTEEWNGSQWRLT